MNVLHLLITLSFLFVHFDFAFSCEDTFDENQSNNIEKYRKSLSNNIRLIRDYVENSDSNPSLTKILSSMQSFDPKEIELKKDLVKYINKILEIYFQNTATLRGNTELLEMSKIDYLIDVLNESFEDTKRNHATYKQLYEALQSKRGSDLEEQLSQISKNLDTNINRIRSMPLIEFQLEALVATPGFKSPINAMIVPNYSSFILSYFEKVYMGIQQHLDNRDYLMSLYIAYTNHYGLMYEHQNHPILKRIDELFRGEAYTKLLEDLGKSSLESFHDLFKIQETQYAFIAFFALFSSQHEALEKIILNPKNKLLTYKKTWTYIRNLYKEPENFDLVKQLYRYSSQQDYPSIDENLMVMAVLEEFKFDSKMIRKLRDYCLDDTSISDQERIYFWKLSLEKSRTPNPYGILESLQSPIEEIRNLSMAYFRKGFELFNHLSIKERLHHLKKHRLFELNQEKFVSWISQDINSFLEYLFESKEELSPSDLALAEKFMKSHNKEQRLLFLTMAFGSKSFNSSHVSYLANISEKQLEDPILQEVFKHPKFLKPILETSYKTLKNPELSLENVKVVLHDLVKIFNLHKQHLDAEELRISEQVFLDTMIQLVMDSTYSSEKMILLFDNTRKIIESHKLWKYFPKMDSKEHVSLKNKILILLIHSSESTPQLGIRTPETKLIYSSLTTENDPVLAPLLARLQEKNTNNLKINLGIDNLKTTTDSALLNYKKMDNTPNSENEIEDYHSRVIERALQHPEIDELEKLLPHIHPSQIKYSELKKILENKHLKPLLSNSEESFVHYFNIRDFLIKIDPNTRNRLSHESKTLFLQFGTLSLELSAHKVKTNIANLDAIHQDLSSLASLLQDSNPEISSSAFRSMKNILNSWKFKYPEIFFEYFTGSFLERLTNENSKKSIEFLLNWIANQHNPKHFLFLCNYVAKSQQDKFENAEIEDVIHYVTNTNHFVLKHLQKQNPNAEDLSLAYVASYLLFLSHGIIHGKLLAQVDLDTVDSSLPIFSEMRKLNLDTLSRPFIVSARFAKRRTYFEKNKIGPNDLEDSITLFATTTLFLHKEQRKGNLDVGRTDVQDSMEETSIYAAILEELSLNRYVWVVDNQHTLGFDILSFDVHKNQFYSIEVKSKLSEENPIMVTSNELESADRYRKAALTQPYIYLVDIFAKLENGKYFQIRKFREIGSEITKDSLVKKDGKKFIIPRSVFSNYFRQEP